MCIDLFSIGKFTIHGYGLMIGLGFFVGILLASKLCKKMGLSDDHFINMAICVLLFGFAGGKILFIIVDFKNFLQNPLGSLGSSGFVVYGGIISGILSAVVYCKIKKISVLSYIDVLAPCAALNQAFGRIGCLMAGCCYGRETSGPLYLVFPEGCLAPAGVHLFPSQILSALANLASTIILIYLLKKAKFKGFTLSMYLLMYSIGRFLIEYTRNDPRGAVGALSTSQFISIFIFIFSIALLLLMKKLDYPVDRVPASASSDESTTADEAIASTIANDNVAADETKVSTPASDDTAASAAEDDNTP